MYADLRGADADPWQSMSIAAADFLSVLRSQGISFIAGVADSLLQPLSLEIEAVGDEVTHVAAPNEGAAVAMAAGHYLATGQVAAVYLQNSGLGNAVNPLLSLADPSVYSIPVVLVVGWRGEPERPDEPQHIAQGRLTLPMLDVLGVTHWVLPEDLRAAEATLIEAIDRAQAKEEPVAVVVPKGGIVGGHQTPPAGSPRGLDRGTVLKTLVDALSSETLFVATTGYTGRELAQLRRDRGEPDERDFLMVGSMGHVASVALGMALGRPDVEVCCVDGDGAFAMHMGAAAAVARQAPPNLLHVVVNNGVHESVGGQATCVGEADLAGVAKALGYPYVAVCRSDEELRESLTGTGLRFIEAIARPGAPRELIRPERLLSRKAALMAALAD